VSKRALAPTAVAVLIALGLPACGGGDDQTPAIKRAVVQASTTRDATLKCGKLATKSFVTRVYGTLAQCHTAEKPSSSDDPSTGATVSDVKVDGDSATVKVRLAGGDTDGASGTIDLRKEQGDWRVDDLGVDFLRSQVQTGLASSGNDQTFKDPKVRDCARQAFVRLPDSELRRIAYLAIAETDEGKTAVGKLLLPCLKLSSGEAGSVSFLRRKFESGIASSARKNGLSASTIDCINGQLRSSISDDEIAKLAFNGGKATAAMKRVSTEAFAQCAGDSGSQGASVLRQLFEKGVRRGAAQRGITRQTIDCVIRRLRSSISDKEIIAAATNAATKAKLGRATGLELLRCR